MDMIPKELITTGGPLGVLVGVVWIFVNYLRTASSEHRAWMEQVSAEHAKTVAGLHQDHLLARAEAVTCIEKNTSALVDNTKATAMLSEAVRTCPLKG